MRCRIGTCSEPVDFLRGVPVEDWPCGTCGETFRERGAGEPVGQLTLDLGE